MDDGDSPYGEVQAHCAFASGPPRTFVDMNTGLGAMLPDLQERDRQGVNKWLRRDNPCLRRKVGHWLSPGNAGIR